MSRITELNKKKKAELLAIAKENDLKVSTKMKKADIINEIISAENKVETLSEVFDFSKICKIKGKSGLWLCKTFVKAGKGRMVMRFFSMRDESIGYTCFNYQDVLCIGHHPELIKLFDATFMLNQDIEINLTTAGYSPGNVKKFTKIYEDLTSYLAELLAIDK